jgi:short-subunit dehydrogenase
MIQREAMKDRVVVITGASAGIGAALADNLAKRSAALRIFTTEWPERRALTAW